MDKVVKVCPNHGKLKKEECQYRKATKKHWSPYYICIKCSRDGINKRYYKNKERQLIRQRAWNKKNKDILNAKQRVYRSKNREKFKQRKNPTDDHYIIRLLLRTLKIDPQEIPKELIDLKRAQLLLKREIRQLNNSPSPKPPVNS